MTKWSGKAHPGKPWWIHRIPVTFLQQAGCRLHPIPIFIMDYHHVSLFEFQWINGLSSCFPISNRPQISPNGSNNIYIATSSIFHCFPTCPVKEQPLGDPNRGPVLLRGVLEPNGYDTDLMVGVHRASKHRECPARVEGPLISNFYACFVISPTWTVCNSMVQLCTARQDLRGVLIWATPLTLVNSASSGKCM